MCFFMFLCVYYIFWEIINNFFILFIEIYKFCVLKVKRDSKVRRRIKREVWFLVRIYIML